MAERLQSREEVQLAISRKMTIFAKLVPIIILLFFLLYNDGVDTRDKGSLWLFEGVSPFRVVLLLGSLVLFDQVLDCLPAVLELVHAVLEDWLFFVVLKEGVAFPELFVLVDHALEELNKEFILHDGCLCCWPSSVRSLCARSPHKGSSCSRRLEWRPGPSR